MAKKQKDGRYAVTKVINGKKRFFYGTTKKAAVEAMEKFLKDSNDCPNYDNRITILSWAKHWLEIKSSSISDITYSSYSQVIRDYILPYLGSVTLAGLTTLNVRGLLKALSDKGLSTRIQCYAYTILSAMIKQAVNEEIISSNVVAKVEKPRQAKVLTLTTLTQDEVQQFLTAVSDPEQYTLFYLAFATGLRRSELLGLSWTDVNFKSSTVTINQTVLKIVNIAIISKTIKNSSSRRTISIDGKPLQN